MDTSRRIQSARIEAGYDTQEAFAGALGVSVWTVRSWEKRKGATRPDNVNMDRIVTLTGKPRAYFFADAEEPGMESLSERLERMRLEIQDLQTGSAPAVAHPGLDALAANAPLRARHRIDDAELEEVRQWVTGRALLQALVESVTPNCDDLPKSHIVWRAL